ncbi:MAG: hypothetical protein SV775_10705 [Thermodesulfobacteriota bacterium]|nr:hypothetical protein [Thermodesulfobacteriota bacterium]
MNFPGRSSKIIIERINKAYSGIALSLGPISIPIQSILELFKSYQTNNERIELRDCPYDLLTYAVVSAVDTLVADRVVSGPGSGGWGRSDVAYSAYLYGEGGEVVTDSVSTTVVTMEALARFFSSIDTLEKWKSGAKQAWWEQTIRQQVREYADKRWNPRTGEGGTLKQGKEGDSVYAPRYRHTAWLVRLWYILPGTFKNLEKTVQALIDGFDFVQWNTQKVATPIAAYTALQRLGTRKTSEGIVSITKREFLQDALIDIVKETYNSDINGWTSGIDPQRGRNLYTLFVLAELAEHWEHVDNELRGMMDKALLRTMEDSCSNCDGSRYISMINSQEADINSTCLVFAALVRKPSLQKNEKKFFEETAKFLIYRFSELKSDTETGLFSWTVAYFVSAMCDILAGEAPVTESKT